MATSKPVASLLCHLRRSAQPRYTSSLRSHQPLRTPTSRLLTTSHRRHQSAQASATTEPFQKPPPSSSSTLTKDSPAPQKQIKYTSDSYPNLKPHSHFSRLTDEHVTALKSVLSSEPESAVLYSPRTSSDPDSNDLDPYNSDWMRKYRGHATLVLRPSSTQQVSKILKYCNEHSLPVCPQGGNSGLVGGSVPVFDEIVLNMGRMNQIRSFDSVSGILVADAGVILEVADGYLRENGHVFPLDLGAKGSCQLGGNVATNAGGLRLLRYGSLHGTVLGVEVVLPDGTILDDLSKLRKNNTGYDLKQLFIGGEGTLGVITGVSVVCPQASPAVNVAFFGLENYEKCQQAFRAAKGKLGEILSAFELMDGTSQDMVEEVTKNKRPLEDKYPFYCLVETSGSNVEHDTEKLAGFLEEVMEKEIVADGVQAQSETQAKEFWRWREGVAEALGHLGGVYKYDLSIPIEDMYRIVEDTRTRLRKEGLMAEEGDVSEDHPVRGVIGYGHMGDTNIHLNVSTRTFDKRIEKALEPWVYEWIRSKKGSISAEHGLGLAKKAFVGYSRDETSLKIMRNIKEMFDPKGIMNPYKYI